MSNTNEASDLYQKAATEHVPKRFVLRSMDLSYPDDLPWLFAITRNGKINTPNPKGKTTMKSSILVAAILASVLSTPVLSAQESLVPAKSAISMDTNKQMPQLQENMKKAQQQMDKIRATTDPTEYQKLIQEHMDTMQENMAMIRHMRGPMMEGVVEHAGMKKKGGKRGSDRTHYEMMEQRMDSMQMMMEQMLSHQQAVSARMPAK